MNTREQVTARLFELSEFTKAVHHKEETGGLLFRIRYQDRSMYEVRYLPPIESGENRYRKAVKQRLNALKLWPVWIHFYLNK